MKFRDTVCLNWPNHMLHEQYGEILGLDPFSCLIGEVIVSFEGLYETLEDEIGLGPTSQKRHDLFEYMNEHGVAFVINKRYLVKR